MPATLEGKVALVTGVSHDGQVGQAVARKLAENAPELWCWMGLCAALKGSYDLLIADF